MQIVPKESLWRGVGVELHFLGHKYCLRHKAVDGGMPPLPSDTEPEFRVMQALYSVLAEIGSTSVCPGSC